MEQHCLCEEIPAFWGPWQAENQTSRSRLEGRPRDVIMLKYYKVILHYRSVIPAFSQASMVSLSQRLAWTSPMWQVPMSSMQTRD